MGCLLDMLYSAYVWLISVFFGAHPRGPSVLIGATFSIYVAFGLASFSSANPSECTETETVTIRETVTVREKFNLDQERQKAIRSALIRATEMVSGVEVYSSSRHRADSTLNSIDQSSSERQVFRSLGTVLEWTQTAETLEIAENGQTALEVTIEATVCLQDDVELPNWIAIGEIAYSDTDAIPVLRRQLLDEFSRSETLMLIQDSPEVAFHDVAISARAEVTEEFVDNTHRHEIIKQFFEPAPIDETALRYHELTATVFLIATRFFDEFQISEIAKRKRRLVDPNALERESHELVQEALRVATHRLRDRLEKRELDP